MGREGTRPRPDSRPRGERRFDETGKPDRPPSDRSGSRPAVARGPSDFSSQLTREWQNELRNLARDPERTADVVSRALEAYELEDYELAARLAEQAKELANRSSLVRELLGLCLYRQERWQDAARELLTFRRFTGSLDQNHVIADCYRALKRPERALEICSEVSRSQVSPETWTEICIVAAGAHGDRNELSEALNSISRAETNPKAIEPYHLKLWYVKADLLSRADRHDDAQKLWELIASVDSNFYDVAERLKAQARDR